MRKITIILISIAFVAKAQQVPLFNTYSYDLMQLNIASIGRTCVEANLNYRAQWTGIKEAPKLYQLNAGFSLGQKNGVGLKVAQQSAGLLKTTNVTAGYAYRVKLNEKAKLHLGLGAAWQQNLFNSNGALIADKNDATLINGSSKLTSNNVDFEAGFLLLGDKLTTGLAVAHLYNTNNKFAANGYKVTPQINAVVAYKFNKGKVVEIEPWLVNRYNIQGVNQVEGILNFRFKQVFIIGGGYRMNYGYIALAGLEVGKIKIAYSYDYTTGNNAKALGTSHQILLGFDLCKAKAEAPKKVAEPKETVYFISENGKDAGPYTVTQLQAMVKEGKMQRLTPVKSSIIATGVSAESMSELEPLFPPKELLYYAMFDGKEKGTYTILQLQNLVKEGKIVRSTSVRNSLEKNRTDAESLKELEPLFPPKVPLYYVKLAGIEIGTFTMEKLKTMVKEGKLLQNAPVRNSLDTTFVNAEKVKELEPLFPKAIKEKTVSNINYLATGLLFGNGKTVLTPDKKSILDEIAAEFKAHPDLKVYVEGFASKTGDPAINKVLSQKRAEHVRQELFKRGVNSSNILGSKAYGSDKATNNNNDESNRAVRFEIVKQ